MFEDIKKAQLIEKIRVMAATGQSGEEIKKSLSKGELDLMKSFSNDIEKGKAAQIGEIRVWQGKKMKKQANGKWVEVSDKGMTKEQHSKKTDELSSKAGEQIGYAFHSKQASKLSDKEYDESEIDLENKIEKLYNKGVDVYIDKDTGEHMYIAMKGDGTYGAYDINDNLIASERKRSDITSSYNLEPVKSIKNKDLENKLSELIDKENFYEKVAEHFGEPDDDGESESALIDRILSHGEEKVKKFMNEVGGENSDNYIEFGNKNDKGFFKIDESKLTLDYINQFKNYLNVKEKELKGQVEVRLKKEPGNYIEFGNKKDGIILKVDEGKFTLDYIGQIRNYLNSKEKILKKKS